MKKETWSAQNIVDSAPFEQWDKDRWYATDLGGCLGGAYFRRLGEPASNPPDARSIRIMRMGKKIEDLVVEDMQRSLEGHPEILLVDTQGYMLDEELCCSGRYDLLVVPRTLPTLLYEIKSVNSKAFWWMAKEGWQAKPEHVMQTQWYLHKLRQKHPNIEGRVLYVSRDDLTIQEIPVEYDQLIVQQSIEKFKLLNDCWEKKTLPPVEPAIMFNAIKSQWQINYKAKYCSHHALCMGDVKWEEKAMEEVARLNALKVRPEDYEPATKPTATKRPRKTNPGRKSRK